MKARSGRAAFLLGAVALGAVALAPKPLVALQSIYRQAAVEVDAEASVLAVSVRFPVGTEADPRGQEGTAFLLGRVLERQGNDALFPLGAAMSVAVDRGEVLASLLTTPDGWAEAVRAFEGVLFRDGLALNHVDAAREAALETLTFEAGAPVRTFDVERATFLYGSLAAEARPPFGSSQSLAPLGLPELEAFRSQHLRRETAVLSATGPVDGEELAAAIAADVRVVGVMGAAGTTTPGSTGAAPSATDTLPPAPRVRFDRAEAPFVPTAAPSSPPGWNAGERVVIERELTSVWIAHAVPFPIGTEPLLLDFLAHLALEALTPSPPDPGLYEASVATMELGGSPVLVVTASVDPRAGTRWETRMTAVVRDLALAPPEGAFFELARRRFRSTVLLDLSVPENRAAWIARQLERGGTEELPDPVRDVWRITGPGVSSLALSAGPARTLLFGPVGMMVGP